MNRAFYIPEVGEIPIINPNRQSYNEECRRFTNLTDTFIGRYGDCLNESGISSITQVTLSDEGEFIEVPRVSVKSAEPAPNIVSLELETTPDNISWRVGGTVDDQYEVIFDDDGQVRVVAHEMSLQNSLLQSRECPEEEAKMIFAVINDILTSLAVRDELKKFDAKSQASARARIDALSGDQKHVKEAKKALKAEMHFNAGSSRSRVFEIGQVTGTSLY